MSRFTAVPRRNASPSRPSRGSAFGRAPRTSPSRRSAAARSNPDGSSAISVPSTIFDDVLTRNLSPGRQSVKGKNWAFSPLRGFQVRNLPHPCSARLGGSLPSEPFTANKWTDVRLFALEHVNCIGNDRRRGPYTGAASKSMKLSNSMEQAVRMHLNRLRAQSPAGDETCWCPLCRADMMALALTSLPPATRPPARATSKSRRGWPRPSATRSCSRAGRSTASRSTPRAPRLRRENPSGW